MTVSQQSPESVYDVVGDDQLSAGGVAPEDVSVAILHPGDRVEKVAVPLRASRMDVEIEPSDPYDRDIVLADNVDTNLAREVLRRPFHDAKLVYRMRGDIFRELETWPMHPVKKWSALNVVLPNVDGVIAVTDRLAAKFSDETGIRPTASAGLCKEPEEWPDVTHEREELRIVTLTNATFWRKVAPLVEWAPVVDAVLDDVGGHWHICGDGSYEDRLAGELEAYDHVSFEGFVDARETLAASNLMIHASRLDGQPNGILEGLASGLPVVTNPWPEFVESGWPLDVATSKRGLAHRLEQYCDPAVRTARGREGVEYVERNHTTDAVATRYERYFAELLDD